MIPHLINAAKYLIPKHWQALQSPTLKEWIGRVDFIYNLEELYNCEEDRKGKFVKAWRNWMEFKSTRKYSGIVKA